MIVRKPLYWIGLFCIALMVLMPDITVTAQSEPGRQGSKGQTPNKILTKEGEEGEQAKQSLRESGCQLVKSTEVPATGAVMNEYDCPAGSRLDGVIRATEQSLIESGCRIVHSHENPRNGSVWKSAECPAGSRFANAVPINQGGPQGWTCLASPDRAMWHFWMFPNGEILKNAHAEIRRGECVPTGGGGGLVESTENAQSPRQVNVKQIPEPTSSDSQVQSDQQQVKSDQQQVKSDQQPVKSDQQPVKSDQPQADKEAQVEENEAPKQSRENDNSKKGYGCSATP